MARATASPPAAPVARPRGAVRRRVRCSREQRRPVRPRWHERTGLSVVADEPEMRVLIVDDDRAVRDSLRRSLELNGYAVDVAADGAEALARGPLIDPDAIVMGAMMPRPEGREGGAEEHTHG